MNRYEKHILYSPGAHRLMSFDACQVQEILHSELPGAHLPGECTAAAIAHKISRHCYRMTFFRYHDSLRTLREPVNPTLTFRLREHVWRKLNPRTHAEYGKAVGRFLH